MSCIESGQFPPVSRDLRSQCPDCPGSLAVMRVIGGKAGSEYWTLRCVRCGGIHLEIVNPRTPTRERDAPPA